MSETSAPKPVSDETPERPATRPLARYWPYVDLPEYPTDEELASLDPELREVLFGIPPGPFSITVVFAKLEGPDYERALAIAKSSAGYTETGSGDTFRHRARFYPADALNLRTMFHIVDRDERTEVLIDDRPVPYARELWLPLVWFLIR